MMKISIYCDLVHQISLYIYDEIPICNYFHTPCIKIKEGAFSINGCIYLHPYTIFFSQS